MMRQLCSGLVMAGVAAAGASLSAQDAMRSALHDYRVVTVAEGLVQPWSIAFVPGGDVLITERPGRLRIVRGGKLLPTPVAGVPDVAYAESGRAARSGAPPELRRQSAAVSHLREEAA